MFASHVLNCWFYWTRNGFRVLSLLLPFPMSLFLDGILAEICMALRHELGVLLIEGGSYHDKVRVVDFCLKIVQYGVIANNNLILLMANITC